MLVYQRVNIKGKYNEYVFNRRKSNVTMGLQVDHNEFGVRSHENST
jgi:hypothetical protein